MIASISAPPVSPESSVTISLRGEVGPVDEEDDVTADEEVLFLWTDLTVFLCAVTLKLS